MTSKGAVISILYSISQNLPVDHLAAAERLLQEEIARLRAVHDGSSNGELESVISSLMAQLEAVGGAVRNIINAQNDIGEHAGRL